MQTFHFPWSINLFSKGVDLDNDPDSLDRSEGSVYDSQNLRSTNLTGHGDSRQKIGGEVIKYPNIDNRCNVGTGSPMPLSYFCIANYQVLNHIVEFWADEKGVGIPYVRVDGWIVLMPTLVSSFPISFSHPPQVHGNDSCVGGEIFYTDDANPPFILNVTDMLTNSGINPANNLRDGTYTCTTKYLSGFNIASYQVQPPSQADHPQFIEIVPTGNTPNAVGIAVTHGTGGMKVGQYQYAIQYVDGTGNVTNWSEMTPQIPLSNSLSYNQPAYPSTKVYGAGASTVSTLGIHIRFRITNTNNYASINIRRATWNVAASLPSLPSDDSVISTINLTNGQIGIVDFYDFDNSTVSPITQSASTQSNLSAIQAAKGIRYYDTRLTLWNITYASRDLSSIISFSTTNGTMYPFVRPLGVQGYKDIWNDVYRKSYFRGEKYGFALVGFDNTGNPTFAIPVPSFNNYQMPNRRDQLIGASLAASVEVDNSLSNPVPLTTAVDSTGVVGTTYEVFDLINATQKDPSYSSATNYNNPITVANDTNTPVKWIFTPVSPNGFNPFRPVSDVDGNNFSYLPTTSVNDGSASDPSIGSGATIGGSLVNPSQPYSGFLQFNPRGFLPNLYSLGMVLQGVSGLPNWCSAFAIVRTAPAGRVVAQGQSFYNLNPNQQTSIGTPSQKDLIGCLWGSPDFDTSIVSVNSILGNPPSARYSMQAVSSLGFFSEVWSGYARNSDVVGSVPSPGVSTSSPDAEIDMISYCRILADNGELNPIASGNTMAGVSGYGKNFVSFSSWRNSTLSPTTYLQKFSLTEFTNTFSSGNSVTAGSAPRRNSSNNLSALYWKSSGGNIYTTANTALQYDYNQSNVKNFHEPVYVTNVVDDTQNVTSSLVQDYFNTGCFVKVSSIIGRISSNLPNQPPSFYLVDERWQDCIPAERSIDATANQDRYVWIQDTNNNITAWINVTYKTSGQITTIANAITNNGFYVSTRCDGSTVNCYGMYSHKITTYTNGNLTSAGEKFYQIVFDQKFPNGNAMIPDVNDYIIVKYDICAPIEVFGGDTFIGEYNYAVADCLNVSDSDPSSTADNFIIDCPLPYRSWQVNENTYIIHDNDPVVGSLSLQLYNNIRFHDLVTKSANIRQWLINGIIESRTNTSLFFNTGNGGMDSFFPDINYVLRPIQWRKWDTNIDPSYNTTYPYEGGTNSNLGYGGFRMIPSYNIDYSETPTQDKSYSKPSSGFTERLNFCSRVLWSDARSTNEQNSPNLKNFPSTNIFDFDDATGEIKRAWDSSVGGQQGNLYAFTENGILMALTEKNILTETSGQQLAFSGNSEGTFIQGEVWLTRTIGMNDQMWRSAAEYDNAIWFANKKDIYKLHNNQILDISSEALKYSSRVKNVLDSIASGYGSDVTAVWNEKYKEYWLCINPHRVIASSPQGQGIDVYDPQSTPSGNYIVVNQDQTVDVQSFIQHLNATTVNPNVVNEFYVINNTSFSIQFQYSAVGFQTLAAGILYRAFYSTSDGFWHLDQNIQNLCNDLIWSEDLNQPAWMGQYKYRFDKYVIDNQGNTYGSRYGATWSLDTGFVMNGTNVQAWVSQVVNPKESYGRNKEFVRLRCASNFVPDTVAWYPTVEMYNTANYHNVILNSQFKNYGSNWNKVWESYINRQPVSPFYRMQGRYAIYTISYSQATDWWISQTQVQYKDLKA